MFGTAFDQRLTAVVTEVAQASDSGECRRDGDNFIQREGMVGPTEDGEAASAWIFPDTEWHEDNAFEDDVEADHGDKTGTDQSERADSWPPSLSPPHDRAPEKHGDDENVDEQPRHDQDGLD